MSSGFHLKAGNFNINKYGAADDYSEEQLFFSEDGDAFKRNRILVRYVAYQLIHKIIHKIQTTEITQKISITFNLIFCQRKNETSCQTCA